MSDIFANYRNNPKGQLYSPQFTYKVKSNEDYWKERKRLTQTMGDNFFKESERYKMNPDYSPKHVGAKWSLNDACDYVKPTSTTLKELFTIKEMSSPLAAAYNTYENPGLNREQRETNYMGPFSPERTASNGFREYINSGGISKKADLT